MATDDMLHSAAPEDPDPFDEPVAELRMGRRELANRLGRAMVAGAVARHGSRSVYHTLARYGWSYRGGSLFLKSIARWFVRHWSAGR